MSSKTAIIDTIGHQYLVVEGEVIKIDKRPEEEGAKITFESVLLAATDKTINIGTPNVAGARVEGEIIDHARYPKITGVKMKAKKRYRRYFGHKQPYTSVKITKITIGK